MPQVQVFAGGAAEPWKRASTAERERRAAPPRIGEFRGPPLRVSRGTGVAEVSASLTSSQQEKHHMSKHRLLRNVASGVLLLSSCAASAACGASPSDTSDTSGAQVNEVAQEDSTQEDSTPECYGEAYFEKDITYACIIATGMPQDYRGGASANCYADPLGIPIPRPVEVQACLQQWVGHWETMNWTCETKLGVGFTSVETKRVPYWTEGRLYRSWVYGKNRENGAHGVCVGPTIRGCGNPDCPH
jgi:hypothetical protein